MTSGILHAFALSSSEKRALSRSPDFKITYRFLGYFYEVKHSSIGFTYLDKDLQHFVKQYTVNPVTADPLVIGVPLPKNWADYLAGHHPLVFKVYHRIMEAKIIHDNYDRFMVYEKIR